MIIEDNFLTEDELRFVNENIIESNDFSLYFNEVTITRNSYAFSHSLVQRNANQPNSDYFDYFVNILKRFIIKNNIQCTTVHRGAINLMISNTQYTFVDPHVDHFWPHKVFIFYLNDLDIQGFYSKTIVFDLPFDKNLTTISAKEFDVSEVPIKHIITPKAGRVVCFDGLNYHTVCFPKPNELRYAVVFTMS